MAHVKQLLLDHSFKLFQAMPNQKQNHDLFMCHFFSTLTEDQCFDWTDHLRTYLGDDNSYENSLIKSGKTLLKELDIPRRLSDLDKVDSTGQAKAIAKSSESGLNQSHSCFHFETQIVKQNLLDHSYKLSKATPTDNGTRDLFLNICSIAMKLF